MAAPKIQDLITYVNKVITGQDWNANWQTVLSWFTSGNTDIKVKSMEVSATGGITNNGSFVQAGNVNIGGNLTVDGSVTGNSFIGDGSLLTGIISAATVNYMPFTANSGNVDANGKSDILYYTGGTGTLNFKVGGTLPVYDNLKATSAQGSTFELSQILDLDVSTYDDGTYTVCVKKNQTVAEVRGTVFRQIDNPSPAGNNGDLWLNTGIEGLVCYEKISGSWNNEYEGVPIGTFTVASGIITSVTSLPFNDNGYNITKETNAYVRNLLQNSSTVPYYNIIDFSNGFCIQTYVIPNNTSPYTITFAVPFISNPIVLATYSGNPDSGDTDSNINVRTISTTATTIYLPRVDANTGAYVVVIGIIEKERRRYNI